jgi:hypothetical protein
MRTFLSARRSFLLLAALHWKGISPSLCVPRTFRVFDEAIVKKHSNNTLHLGCFKTYSFFYHIRVCAPGLIKFRPMRWVFYYLNRVQLNSLDESTLEGFDEVSYFDQFLSIFLKYSHYGENNNVRSVVDLNQSQFLFSSNLLSQYMEK